MAVPDELRRACDRLRRLSEQRWAQPPRPPTGSRSPLAPLTRSAPTLEVEVRAACERLMHADAAARGVHAFRSQVGVFALADMLGALARSVAAHGDAAALGVLRDVAAEARHW